MLINHKIKELLNFSTSTQKNGLLEFYLDLFKNTLNLHSLKKIKINSSLNIGMQISDKNLLKF